MKYLTNLGIVTILIFGLFPGQAAIGEEESQEEEFRTGTIEVAIRGQDGKITTIRREVRYHEGAEDASSQNRNNIPDWIKEEARKAAEREVATIVSSDSGGGFSSNSLIEVVEGRAEYWARNKPFDPSEPLNLLRAPLRTLARDSSSGSRTDREVVSDSARSCRPCQRAGLPDIRADEIMRRAGDRQEAERRREAKSSLGQPPLPPSPPLPSGRKPYRRISAAEVQQRIRSRQIWVEQNIGQYLEQEKIRLEEERQRWQERLDVLQEKLCDEEVEKELLRFLKIHFGVEDEETLEYRMEINKDEVDSHRARIRRRAEAEVKSFSEQIDRIESRLQEVRAGIATLKAELSVSNAN